MNYNALDGWCSVASMTLKTQQAWSIRNCQLLGNLGYAAHLQMHKAGIDQGQLNILVFIDWNLIVRTYRLWAPLFRLPAPIYPVHSIIFHIRVIIYLLLGCIAHAIGSEGSEGLGCRLFSCLDLLGWLGQLGFLDLSSLIQPLFGSQSDTDVVSAIDEFSFEDSDNSFLCSRINHFCLVEIGSKGIQRMLLECSLASRNGLISRGRS